MSNRPFNPHLFEMRRAPRYRLVPACHGVTVQIAGAEAAAAIDGHVYDLSVSGARIEVDEPLGLGTRIGMCMDLPGVPRPVMVSGRVVRQYDAEDDPGARRIAVRFGRYLNDRHRHRLGRYLDQTPARLAA